MAPWARLLACLLLATGLSLAAAEGDPDPLFNGGQFRRIAFQGIGPGTVYWAGYDNAGRLLLGGTASDGERDTLVCMRLTADGAIDPAYGSGGIARLIHHPVVSMHGMVVRGDGDPRRRRRR